MQNNSETLSAMITYENLATNLLRNAEKLTPETERTKALLTLSEFVNRKIAADKPLRLNFICTHNSRRSHFGQVMAQVLGAYLKIPNLETYSGGTEATAFHPNAVRTLVDLGVVVEKLDAGENPHYQITTGSIVTTAFSKQYFAIPNPQKTFAAIMVCSSADAGCPVVAGADQRISLPFEDPKVSDGTPEQSATYKERAIQIGTELAWAFLKAV